MHAIFISNDILDIITGNSEAIGRMPTKEAAKKIWMKKGYVYFIVYDGSCRLIL